MDAFFLIFQENAIFVIQKKPKFSEIVIQSYRGGKGGRSWYIEYKNRDILTKIHSCGHFGANIDHFGDFHFTPCIFCVIGSTTFLSMGIGCRHQNNSVLVKGPTFGSYWVQDGAVFDHHFQERKDR